MKINIPEYIRPIIDGIVSDNSGVMDNITVLNGISTITTTGNISNLKSGMIVEIGNYTYSVIDVLTDGFTVKATSLVIGEPWQLALYYDFGHQIEITNTIKSYKKITTRQNKVMPLFWCITDIEEKRTTGEERFLYNYDANLRFSLVYYSKENYKSDERVENVHEPILYPLYDLIEEAFKRSRCFFLPLSDMPNWTPIDRYNYGSQKNNAHFLGDSVTDAIELDWRGAKIIEPRSNNCN